MSSDGSLVLRGMEDEAESYYKQAPDLLWMAQRVHETFT